MQRMELIECLGADLHIPANVSDPREDTWLFVSLISFHVMPPDRAHRYYLDYSSVNSYCLSVYHIDITYLFNNLGNAILFCS